jgi:hypothetical protein
MKHAGLLLSIAVAFTALGAMSPRAAHGQAVPAPAAPPTPPPNPDIVPLEPSSPGAATVAPPPPAEAPAAAVAAPRSARAAGDGEEPGRPAVEPHFGPEPRFGDEGEIVLSGILDASLGHLVYSSGNDSSTSFKVEPAFEYFVFPDFSVGVSAFFGYSNSTSGIDISDRNVQYGVTGKIGSNVWLGNAVSLWPRFSLGAWQSRSTFSGGNGGYISVDGGSVAVGSGTEVTENAMFVEVYAPVLIHPAQHFFVGIGPDGYIDLFHSASGLSNKRSFLGLSTTVGGWF